MGDRKISDEQERRRLRSHHDLDEDDASFIDFLDELRRENDFLYAVRSKRWVRYVGPDAVDRPPRRIMDETLRSDRVKQAIQTAAVERNWSVEATEKEARRIGDEMAYDFDLKTVRPLAYLAKKIVPRLFTGVYVNVERLQQVRRICADTPVIFMPTHRTYMDFILLQFLCFHYEIPCPAIASAVDFLNMKYMGEALRRCGAFFIRRSFGDDRLYWAIFTEYVENQLKHADRTMEFFIEGTRSRTGKSLHPKYGLLSTLLAPYFRNEVYDIALVPISVSFGKFLEENLYAYELLGFPKPKESTSGLLKARGVLNTDFGDVFVRLAKPISVREYFHSLKNGVGGVQRWIHSTKPSNMFEFTLDEQREIRKLGHRIVKIQENNTVVRLWPLMCAVLCRMLRADTKSIFQNVAPYDDFLRGVERLLDTAERLRCRIPLRTGSFTDEFTYFFRLHSNIVERVSDGRTVLLKPVSTRVGDRTDSTLSGRLVDAAVPRIMIANYANQAAHLFSDVSFLCFSILVGSGDGTDQNRKSRIYDDFAFLQTLFNREFVSVPGDEKASFDDAMAKLHSAGILDEKSITEDLNFCYDLASMTEQFLLGYFVVCDYFLTTTEPVDEKTFVKNVQRRVGQLLEERNVAVVEALSSDLLKNCLHSLIDLKAVEKRKENNESGKKFAPVLPVVDAVKRRLGKFLAALPNSDLKKMDHDLVKAKL